MENASKALIIVGSVLLTVMLISVAVYVFNRGKAFSDSSASQSSSVALRNFNAQFSGFQSDGNWYGVTIVNSDNKYSASVGLNNISDVVTAVNLAVNINYENNYGYGYFSQVETENAVEIVIDLSGYEPEDEDNSNINDYDYYLIEPAKEVDTGYVYGTSSIDTDSRANRISSFSASNSISCNDLLKELSSSKMETYNEKTYTLYHYYFKGELDYDEKSGQVNSVYFTLISDEDW